MQILKEGDVVYIISEDREAVITHPEVFLKRDLEFKLLYNVHDRVNNKLKN